MEWPNRPKPIIRCATGIEVNSTLNKYVVLSPLKSKLEATALKKENNCNRDIYIKVKVLHSTNEVGR